ncbi:MAG: hypothetical protein WD556_07385 [Actinomycetota bacterium]
MNATELDPAAGILVRSYLDTGLESVRFKDRYGLPFSVALKAHFMRTVAQSNFLKHGRYRLGKEYAEFGRVQFEDTETEMIYLLKSSGAITVEAARQLRFFGRDEFDTSDVTLAIYKFTNEGLDLSVVEARRVPGRKKLVALDEPRKIGTWLFAPDDGAPFDQSYPDSFEELGDIDMDDEGDVGS